MENEKDLSDSVSQYEMENEKDLSDSESDLEEDIVFGKISY
jgi:hypothetical protein